MPYVVIAAVVILCAIAGPSAADEYLRGEVTWHRQGDGWHGQRTACGQLANNYGLTAAHPNLPCGSQVQVYVTDKNGHRTGAPLIVTINDHGRVLWERGHVLKLSYGAARALGLAPRRSKSAQIVAKVLR